MKRIAIIFTAIVCAFGLQAQQVPPPGYVIVDSLVFTPISSVGSTLEGSTIFTVLPENVRVSQSGIVRNAVETRTRANRGKMHNGYRIRIFFDNSQSARGASEAALYRFKVQNPGISAYRSFSSPYFKVTVGDFRNKSEAMEALGPIKQQFPSAFIVRERFKYPSIAKKSGYKVDTLRILKKVE